MASSTAVTNMAISTAQKSLNFAASVTGSAMIFRSLYSDYVPARVQDYIYSTLSCLLSRRLPRPADLTLVIDQPRSYESNELYCASEAYVGSLVSPSTTRLRIVKKKDDPSMLVTVDSGEEVVDIFQGIEFRWRLVAYERGKEEDAQKFELTFNRDHRDTALGKYLSHVLDRWNAMKDAERPLRYHMLMYGDWRGVDLNHPATFDTVAMEPDLKRMVVEDLERFVKRREFYRRVGKAWKRGYLLYGPPGTGKSSLVAAIANYLKFDVYDLELTAVRDNTELREILMSMENKSILVVEDVDCTVKIANRESEDDNDGKKEGGLTLSGLLNFIDGFWSSCRDERITVFTTNHPEKLDPALLRPGRMDVHVHMSYCTPDGFRALAGNYHCIEEHPMFAEIERMMEEEVDVTPAEVTGELMKSEDADEALELLVRFMEEKKGDPQRRKGRKKLRGENGEGEAMDGASSCTFAEESGSSGGEGEMRCITENFD